MGTFNERIEELQERVGRGNLIMRAVVHQAYAAAEHNREYYQHLHGGEAEFLKIPFEAHHGEMIEKLADGILGDPVAAAIEAVQKFDQWVTENAPVRTGTLKNSTNLYVENDGLRVYEQVQRAPFNAKKE